MREKIYSRISNPVVANAIASFTRPVGDARGIVINAICSNARGVALNAANAVATNRAPAGRVWSVHVT